MTAFIDEVLTAKRLPAPAMRRAIREAAGVTQARLAKEIGVTDRSIANWETGSSRPSPRHLGTYAELLCALQEAMAP